ncbi:MAG: ABC transporter substrate-binding protein [Planctomycetes bacterium]|nr:ABC transporter substrate-binding protein [Planctomycetota bacterium]
MAMGILVVAIAGCSPPRAVRVGVIVPRSGANAAFGEQFERGLALALEASPNRIELDVRDDEADPSRSAELVGDLASDERVVAIVGSVTGPCCLAAAGRAQLLGIPLLSPAGTDPRIAEGCEWVFQTCFTDSQQGTEMAAFAKLRDFRRVAILEDLTNDYSIGLAASFADAFLKGGGEIVDEAAYRGDRFDAGATARWLGDLACDAVFLPLYFPDVVRIVEATAPVWRSKALAFLGGDGWDSSDEESRSVEWPDSVWITNHFSPQDMDSRVLDFCRMSRWSSSGATPSSLSALAYDAGRLITRVVEAGARTRGAAKQAIARSLDDGFPGVTGMLVADPVTRERRKEVKILRWSAGSWVRDR